MAASAQPAQQVAELLSILKRRKAWILVPPIITFTLAFVLAALLPRQFEASTIIEVKEIVLLEDPTVEKIHEHPVIRNLALLPNRLKDLRLLESVIGQELQWDGFLKIAGDPVTKREYLQEVAKRLTVAVTQRGPMDVGNDRVFIVYRDSSPSRTKNFIDKLSEVFMREARDDYRARVEEQRNLLKLEHENQARGITDLIQKIHDLVKDNDLPRAAADTENPQALVFKDPVEVELVQVSDDLRKAEAALEELNLRIDAAQTELATLPEWLDQKQIQRSQVEEGGPYATYILTLEAEKTKLHEQIGNKRTQGENIHPTVRVALQKIEQIEAQQKELLGQLQGGEGQEEESRASNPRFIDQSRVVQQLITDRDTKRAEVARLKGLEEEKRSEREYKIDAYRTLSEYGRRLEELKIDNDATLAALNVKEVIFNRLRSEAGNPFEIILPPIEPRDAVWPSVPIILGIGIFLGLGIGFALAFLTEFGRLSFRTIEDVGRSLSVPVLGAVNLILTPKQIRKRRFSRLATALGLVVFLGALVGFAWLYAKHPERLPRWLVQPVDKLIRGEA